MKLMEAVIWELHDIFLDRSVTLDGTSRTFPVRYGVSAGDIAIAPLQAQLHPSDGKVGIGFAMNQLPREYTDAFGGGFFSGDRDRYSLDVTIIVLGTVTDAYKILLGASEYLISGLRLESGDSIGDPAYDKLILIQDNGETTQGLDELDNFSLTRNFTIETMR